MNPSRSNAGLANRDLAERIGYLALRHKSAELTETEFAELEDLLRTSEPARVLYAEFVHDSVKLTRVLAGNATTSVDTVTTAIGLSVPSTPQPRSSRDFLGQHNFAVAMVVAFATLAAVVTWMGFSYLPGVAKNKNKPAAEAQDEVIARLVRVHDIEWADGGVPPSTRYKSGTRLAFTKGLVAIRYTTGAEVVIEGPATYFVGVNSESEQAAAAASSRNAGFLARGKLVARCDTKASQGFTVCTPYACIEDYGTEFGVDVDERGAAEFVVITGAVDVVKGSDDGPQQRIRLVSGQGAFVANRSARITKRKKADVRFITAMRSRLETIDDKSPPVATTLVASFDLQGRSTDPLASDDFKGADNPNGPSFTGQVGDWAVIHTGAGGASATDDGITLSFTPSAGWQNTVGSGSQPRTDAIRLISAAANASHAHGNVAWTLTGLKPNGIYGMIWINKLPGQARIPNVGVTGFDAGNGIGAVPTPDADGDLNFYGVQADANGKISGTWFVEGGPDSITAVAGVQVGEIAPAAPGMSPTVNDEGVRTQERQETRTDK